MTLVIIGIALLVVAAACWFGARHQRTKVNQLKTGETYRCADVGETLVGQVCEVAGVAQPGPEGPVTGPMSGREGVWFAQKITRHWYETRADDSDHDHRRERVKRQQVVSSSRSQEPF